MKYTTESSLPSIFKVIENLKEKLRLTVAINLTAPKSNRYWMKYEDQECSPEHGKKKNFS